MDYITNVLEIDGVDYGYYAMSGGEMLLATTNYVLGYRRFRKPKKIIEYRKTLMLPNEIVLMLDVLRDPVVDVEATEDERAEYVIPSLEASKEVVHDRIYDGLEALYKSRDEEFTVNNQSTLDFLEERFKVKDDAITNELVDMGFLGILTEVGTVSRSYFIRANKYLDVQIAVYRYTKDHIMSLEMYVYPIELIVVALHNG